MANLTVTIDVPDLSVIQNSNFFAPFYAHLASTKGEAETKIKKILQDYARDGHKKSGGTHYQNQTGRLSKSTKVEGSLDKEIRLYVDTTQLDNYAGWIVNGHRRGKNGKLITWNNGKGDPFIDETMKAKLPEITKIIIDFYNQAIAIFNARTTP